MKLDGPTYREKFLLSLAGFAFLFVLAYKQSFSTTMQLNKECNAIERSLLEQRISVQEMSPYTDHQLPYDDFEVEENSSRDFDQLLLDKVAEYCEERPVELFQYKPPHIFMADKYRIDSQILTVKGEYQSIMQLLFLLEEEMKLTSVSSIDFTTKKDRRTGKITLYATLYIQKIRLV